MGEIEKRLQYAAAAIPQTPAVDQSLISKTKEIEKAISIARLSLNGDRTISRRAEPVADTIGAIIGYLTWSRSENTGPVTKLQQQRFKRASEGYVVVYEHLKNLNENVRAIETQLNNAGAAWTPGSCPIKEN